MVKDSGKDCPEEFNNYEINLEDNYIYNNHINDKDDRTYFNEENTSNKRNYLNFGENDQMEIEGYVPNTFKICFIWILYICTLGLLRLIFHWYPHWKLIATHSICKLDCATSVLIVDNYKNKYKSHIVKEIQTLEADDKHTNCDKNEENPKWLTVYLCNGSMKKQQRIKILKCKKITYVWDERKDKFVKLVGLDKGIKNIDLRRFPGYSKKEQQLMQITYGKNEINVPVQSVTTLLILEALTPFYIFQLFSLIVWFAEYYYYYTVAIVIMSVFGISTSIIQTRKNQMNLKGTIHSIDKVMVKRRKFQYSNGECDEFEEIPTTDLVPGDVIAIPAHGCEMQCDAILLNGNCIVNESMLTGESVPIIKTPLPNSNLLYDLKENANNTLFCGTKIIQTRYYANERVTAVVTRTGYLTTKGQLVRSIIYPPPADFKFDQDSYKFIMILALIALLGFLYTVFSKYSRDIAPMDILIKALDLVTIAIPPALPAAMTVGKLYALNRLKKNNIFCINSRVINVSGSVNCVCFDKTGTLTEDGLDMWGILPIDGAANDISEPIRNGKYVDTESLLFQGMLVCHSLTIIDNALSGDPLDVKMFEFTNSTLEEPAVCDNNKFDLLVPTIIKKNKCEIGIIKQFQFSSSLQRMSVISKNLYSDHFNVFCKGAPEKIIALSRIETVPSGIFEKLREFTQQGFRVIGMGSKQLKGTFCKLSKMQRDEIECNLNFIGLIIFENRLKPETTSIISTLQNAKMKIIMITGDNIQTAISVARECGIIQPNYSIIDVVTKKPTKFQCASIEYYEHDLINSTNNQYTICKNGIDCINIEKQYRFVINGNSWSDLNQYFPHLISKIVTKGVIFARMSGHQKQQLIEELQNIGYYVAMCGDGANDCGALKAAHVGISLSEAESSVASPFTSKESNISCVPKIIKEGRAALVTSFGVFKLMLCYSLTEFASVIILYAIDTNLTSLQFLFIDICLILNFASFFGKTKAYDNLYKIPPMTSLLSFIPLTSIILFMFVTIAFQMFSFYYIQTFEWFEPFEFNPDNPTDYVSFENYAVFTVSMFQYITMAVVFSKSKPYRKSIYTNTLFLIAILLMILICSYITLSPMHWIVDALELKMPPQYDGRILMLLIGLVNFFVCFMIEDIFIEYILNKIHYYFKCTNNDKMYLFLENEFNSEQSWLSMIVEKNNENGIENCGYQNNEIVHVTKF